MTWEVQHGEERYGVEVRQVTYDKREYQSTNNFHNSDR